MHAEGNAELGYILMGYPRISETFISNEIHLLESMGMKIRLFSVKRGDETRVNAVVTKIQATPCYLPRTTSVSGTRLITWLRRNVPSYAVSHGEVFRSRPVAYLGTLVAAIRMSWKYRGGWLARPKNVYIKEFFQAGFIAREVLESGRIRHLHGHFCHGVTNITWFVSRITGIPFSFTAHAKDIYRPNLNPGDLLERKLAAARFVTTCTAANESYLRLRCPDSAKIFTVYHGLDTEYFAPESESREPGSAPVVLSVGRFVEKKGFDYLIDACALMKRAGQRFQCVIVGERGDDFDDRFDQISEKARALGLDDSVSLLDAVTQDELKAIYRRATVFVLPCRVTSDGDRDGIPNVLAEAMAMGIPVVSTAISGIPELVDDGVDGLLVPEKDSAALAEAVQRLLSRPDLRDRLSRESRKKICSCFDSRKTTSALKRLFVDAIDAQRAGA
jgi:glycosyltransferase involved in cell wall biosynthesis